MRCLKIIALLYMTLITNEQVNSAVLRIKRQAVEEALDDKTIKAVDIKPKAGDEKLDNALEKTVDVIEKVGDDQSNVKAATDDLEKSGEEKGKAAEAKGKSGENLEKLGDVKEKVIEAKAKVDKDTVNSSEATVKSSKDADAVKADAKLLDVKKDETNKDKKSAQEKSGEANKVTKIEKSVGEKEKSAEKKKTFGARTLNTKGNQLKEHDDKKDDFEKIDERIWQNDKPHKEPTGLKNIVVIPEKDTSVINLTVFNRAPDQEFLRALRKEKQPVIARNKGIHEEEDSDAKSNKKQSKEEVDAFRINADTPCFLNSYNQIECGLNSVLRDPNVSDNAANDILTKLSDNAAFFEVSARNKNFANDGTGQYFDYSNDGLTPYYNVANDYTYIPYSSSANANGGLNPYVNYDNLNDIQRAQLLIWSP